MNESTPPAVEPTTVPFLMVTDGPAWRSSTGKANVVATSDSKANVLYMMGFVGGSHPHDCLPAILDVGRRMSRTYMETWCPIFASVVGHLTVVEP